MRVVSPWMIILGRQKRVNSDEHYRKQLEEGAREYYEKWIAPEVVIQRLLEKVSERLESET